jgi:glyceraldehyde-3-phosphate dehydrogenase (NADP+)
MALDISHPRLLVGDQWIDSPNTFDVIDPFTQKRISTVPQGDAKLLNDAIDAAHAAFEKTRRQPPYARADILHSAAAIVRRRMGELVEAMIAESGKPITAAEAEVDRTIVTLTASAEAARGPNGAVLDIDSFATGANHLGLVRRFPLGVIYCITPFNFPLNLVAHKLGPLIATGNTALLKPSPRTPLSALLLAEILLEVGMIPGQVNVVTCPNELAARPLADPRVKMVSFTGSAKVGWDIRNKADRKKVTLELGGNAPAIVEPDADLASAIPILAAAGFGYAGQSCIHTQRIYVHQSIYNTFRERFVKQVQEKIKAGDPHDRAVQVGPLIDRANVDRISSWVKEAVAGRAVLLTGGHASGSIYEPTVLENVKPDAKVLCDEVFGPVVVLQPYATFDEAIELANRGPYGLQAGIFTRDLDKAMAAYERLDFGGVLVNQSPTFRVETMPYGGIKDSGLGREGIRYAMDEMTEPKTLIVKRNKS